MLGHLLASPTGRNAYLIHGIVREKRIVAIGGVDTHTRMLLQVERVPRSWLDVPGIVVHGLRWDSRAPRRRPQGAP